MASLSEDAVVASLPVPQIAAPPGEVFSEDQWNVLFSILEVFLPSITAEPRDGKSLVSKTEFDEAVSSVQRYLPADAPSDLAVRYLAESPTTDPTFRALLKRRFKLFVPQQNAQGLGMILSTLDNSVGSFILTGYTELLTRQPLDIRTQIVCAWAHGRLSPMRAVHRSMATLAKQCWVMTSPLVMKTIGFSATPKNLERRDGYAFQFHDFTSSSQPTTLTTDVVIVGSGCGAGVVASHLARAGLKCLVLEKGYHFSSAYFPMSGTDSSEHQYEGGGAIVSDDGSTVVLAGATFGGGGTVNWSACLQPPHAVRKEWATNNLPHFLSPEYQDCLDTVCARMGVAQSNDPVALAKIEHNIPNTTLLEGARRLGMAVEIVPQNTGHRPHRCGSCTYGCSSATKQGPANCWFPDAAEHGAEFIEGCFVEEVLFSPGPGTSKTATGVRATWTSRDRSTTRELTVHARRVVVAAGTMNSPLVLGRSGLKNPHIGANLHLHPTLTTTGTYPTRVEPWDGSILTVAMTDVQDQDGHHHGPKVEVMCGMPTLNLIMGPWRAAASTAAQREGTSALTSAIKYRVNAAKYAHGASFVVITRDQDTGRVYADPADRHRVRFAYTTSKRDAKRVLEGIVAGARIQFAMGATEIDTTNPEAPRWVRPSTSGAGGAGSSAEEDAASFENYIAALRAVGISSPDPVMFGSAHQMGTCRMAGYAGDGVVDARGAVWGTQGLYVADASVFPSASGVNPMISTMGIAEWIARGLVRDMQA